MKDDNLECPWCGSSFEDKKELVIHTQEHYAPPIGV